MTPSLPFNLDEEIVRLKRLALRLVRDDATADDVVQEVWLASLKTPPSEYTNGEAWLRAVAVNISRAEHRQRFQRASREARAAVEESFEDSPLVSMARESVHSALRRALDELDEPYGTSLKRHYLEGWTAKRIATMESLPLATVQSHLRRGLERLRAKLEPEFGEGRAFSLALIGAFDWDRAEARALAHSGASAGGLWMGWPKFAALVALLIGGAAALWQVLPRASDPTDLGREAVDLAQRRAADAVRPAESVEEPPTERVERSEPVIPTADGTPVSPLTSEVATGRPSGAQDVIAIVSEEGAGALPGATLWKRGPDGFSSAGTTDAQGRCRVAIEAEDFTVSYRVNGISKDYVELMAVGSGLGFSGRYLIDPHAVGDGEGPREVNMLLVSEGVWFEGVIRDTAGQPLEGARVFEPLTSRPGRSVATQPIVRSADDFPIVPRFPDVHSDAQGRFSIRGLRGTASALVVSKPGYGTVPLNASGLTDGRRLEVVLREEVAVEGVVYAPDGTVASGVTVTFSPLAGGRSPASTTVTSERGAFRIGDLAAGEGVLMLARGRDALCVAVTVDPSRSYYGEYHLEPAAMLEVQFVDEEGAPRTDLELNLKGVRNVQGRPKQPLVYEVRGLPTDPSGRIRVQGCPSVLKLQVFGPDSDAPILLRTLDPVPGELMTLGCGRQPDSLAAVTGTLVRKGRPAPQLTTVALWHVGAELPFHGEVSRDTGRVDFEQIPAGTYDMIYFQEGNSAGRATTVEIAGGVADLGEIVLPPMGQLTVRTPWSESEARTVRVRELMIGSNGSTSVHSLFEGTLHGTRSWNLIPGVYAIIVMRDDGSPLYQRVWKIRPEQTTDIALSLAPPPYAFVDLVGGDGGVPSLEVEVHCVSAAVAATAAAEGGDALDQATGEASLVSQQTTRRGFGDIFRLEFPLDRNGRWIVIAQSPDGRIDRWLVPDLPPHALFHFQWELGSGQGR